MKEYIKSKQFLLEDFLRKKNMKYEDCDERQKQILKLENPVMWDLYQWNI